MADGFKIKPESLRAASAQFTVAADTLTAGLADLEGWLATLGDLCGADKQGQEFAQVYLPGREAVEAVLPKLAAGLASFHDGLQAMADEHEAIDRAKAEALRTKGKK